MAQRVAAIFISREAAERAADALVDLGAEWEHVSMLSRGESGGVTASQVERREGEDFVEPAREVGDTGAPITTTDEHEAARGATTGAVVGAGVGIAAGLASLMVPGFGIIMAAGPLAWAIGGAAGATAAGAVAGGVFGGLRDIGIEEKYARTYEERLRGGDVLLTASLPTMVSNDRVLEVLAEHGAEDVSLTQDTWTGRTDVYSQNMTHADQEEEEVTDAMRHSRF
jgi:hypothetical protein